MPATDTPYIIGVIREKEKSLLQADEFTRMIQAPTPRDAVQTLVDTPYGVHMEGDAPFAALTAHLEEEYAWLDELAEDSRLMTFIGAQYDALHAANAIADYAAGSHLRENAKLGTIDHYELNAALERDSEWDYIPVYWRDILREAKRHIDDPEIEVNVPQLLDRIGEHAFTVMDQVAFTTLMRALAEHERRRGTFGAFLRGRGEYEEGSEPETPAFVDPATIDELTEGKSAVAYERMWDAHLVELLRAHRYEPTGYDAVAAYWYAKEVEVKTVRLVLSAKLGGLTEETIRKLQRPLYLASA